jgi:hypothetical protein
MANAGLIRTGAITTQTTASAASARAAAISASRARDAEIRRRIANRALIKQREAARARAAAKAQALANAKRARARARAAALAETLRLRDQAERNRARAAAYEAAEQQRLADRAARDARNKAAEDHEARAVAGEFGAAEQLWFRELQEKRERLTGFKPGQDPGTFTPFTPDMAARARRSGEPPSRARARAWRDARHWLPAWIYDQTTAGKELLEIADREARIRGQKARSGAHDPEILRREMEARRAALAQRRRELAERRRTMPSLATGKGGLLSLFKFIGVDSGEKRKPYVEVPHQGLVEEKFAEWKEGPIYAFPLLR